MIESSSKQKEETWFVENTLMAILDFFFHKCWCIISPLLRPSTKMLSDANC